tara:strand:- start:4738 stop:6459 length:1722 start_codon:yes stop_codon:yes gene_type:complete
LVTRFLVLLLFLSFVSSESIQISVDKNQLEAGELLKLSIEVIDGEDFAKVDLSLLENNFEIISGPSQQTNIQWVNGQMTSIKTLSWSILPKKSGDLIIPALSGFVGDKRFKGKKIKIKVGEINDDSNEVYITAEIDKENAYLGEQITLTYKLYKRVDVNIAGIDQFQMPNFKGFWVEELFTPQRLQYQSKKIRINGVDYQVAHLGQRALFPIASENHVIPSVKVKVQLEVKKKKRRRDPFFDPFFDSFLSETRTRILSSKNKNISIINYPQPIPDDFTGAVGQFDLSTNIDRNDVEVNDGVTLTILLNGTGNIGLFSLPEPKFSDDIEVFPPTENFEKDEFRNQITGKQKWEYILIPRKPGTLVIPKTKMSFFDPIEKTWKTIQTKKTNINVSPGKSILVSDEGFTKKEIELIGQDIRYMNTGSTDLVQKGKMNFSLVLTIYLISLSILMAPFMINKFTGYRLATANDRKINNALKLSMKTLNNNFHDNPFELASKSLYSYLKNKFSLNSDNLDITRVREILNDKIDKELCNEIIKILTTCDRGRFSPEAIDKGYGIIDEMRILLKRVDRHIS